MLTNARICTSEAGTSSSAGHQLDVVTIEKDLGSNLKVAEHCYDAYSKANKMSGLVQRTIKHRSPDLMVRMYKSLVRPPRARAQYTVIGCD